ncbi:conserved hypothetical protein [Burkholderia mallei PRL-20]|uniref:Uncharacterized protein n=1 Tax=Burkholderia mallei (strain NCTC 10229) TaxID=412022 RepID=A2S631_BURM9|nr:hypothetical protein BMASAVP1_A0176 [Burkholderia mallei SAVP1]ABN01607.1 hypothetical protein BMA10229_A1416 [Burkholderia mallei NCTC 10229]ABN84029.1 hypothetical protein BURPS668_0483 [Burkholderia pseudomallei 668]ABO07138.1 hypothetical protein BMA10247_2843 [Burkholderia mallei NCTC 10247]EDK54742.1 hypothetical protein BMAFMH_B0674 [Burkholderia mallei FMH]EDK59713.1 hypothetical protein BMAJHU_B0652 [Burkholderia mallei JHU]EDP86189.1 hypothetical protein BMA10399_D0855 [Burkholde
MPPGGSRCASRIERRRRAATRGAYPSEAIGIDIDVDMAPANRNERRQNRTSAVR